LDDDWFPGITPTRDESPGIDTSVAHPARIYDYILGGKDNFAADKAAADAVISANPHAVTAMRENRAAMRRIAAFLAGEAGIRQFLDIGTGLPTSPNLHEIVQALAPSAHIVYVDNDPIVLAHARALLTSSKEGQCAYIEADLRDPDAILAELRELGTLNFSQPIALMLFGIMHFVSDEEDAHGIVAKLMSALAPGSYLAIQQATADFYPPGAGSAAAYGQVGIPFHYRSKDEFARFLAGLEQVPPGIAPMAEWRADNEPQPRPAPGEASAYVAVARKV
jgi:S-adenosyl methyltransferase